VVNRSTLEAALRHDYVCVSVYCDVMSKCYYGSVVRRCMLSICVLNPFIFFDPSFLQRD
jgi:hypothetical protein